MEWKHLIILALAVATSLGQSDEALEESCPAQGPHIFFGNSQTESAASAGAIRLIGHVLHECFDFWCDNIHERKYRSIDGTCNNAQNIGAAFTKAGRLLPNKYDDDVDCPRQTGVDGTPLPSARAVSKAVHPDDMNKRAPLTHMLMQWGQFLDHDLTAFPVFSEFDSTITCCGANRTDPPYRRDKKCFPIELPDGDSFRGSCMEFVRSVPGGDIKGNIVYPREQINSLTAFVDGSQIYGSTEEVLEEVRDGHTAFLKTEKVKGEDFLPSNENPSSCMVRPNSYDYCFLAGDERVNEQPGLGSMHTLWVREHNRIAGELTSLKPNDDEEEIFQLTRKIVGALLQKITYNDWLPRVIGPAAARGRLLSRAGRTVYNPAIRPEIFNVFATAAFRFGHSLIPPNFQIGSRSVPLRELFNRPAEVLDSFEDVLAGLAGSGSGQSRFVEEVDRNFVAEITEELFQVASDPPGSGFDLVARNIQRGRDHGLPSYTMWRNYCGLRNLTGFDDQDALGPNSADLATVYKSVDDIDVFTGLMHEPPIQGETGIVGPTLACLLSAQFFNLKFGDRYFFDTIDQNFGFTDDQLEAIRQHTLTRVICDNTQLDKLPDDIFRVRSNNNKVRCNNQRGKLDLSKF